MLFYEGNVSTLKENEVFVFGSNPEGRHGAGAAKVAMNKFGAIYSKGRGLYGQSYALPTKNLTENYEEQISSRKVIKYKKAGFRSISKDQIKSNIKDFYKVARKEKDKVFYIAYKNDSKNLNGYSSEEMIEMFFEGFRLPKNIVFSNTFEDLLKEKGYLKEDKYKIVMDGIEHLNVYSKAKTVLGRKLTNMSNVSFNIEIEGKIINFKSLEGYWYFLKKKLLLKEKDLKYSEYDCFEAKDRGKKELKDLSLSKSDYEVFQKKIKESLRLKVEQNSDIQRLMIMNDL
ncbi:hypothetical protein HOK00_06735, partial [bacterium]|nr:hypothetical protein [bacterium]